ncbi:uncharacterized protein LOC134220405 [Armigeres subalbatus]|uniref:uncharacterized protein LOC134220405 n=1 Tax=Armigeres subalbatus TaxID=124917 RepID=UPI002ED24103
MAFKLGLLICALIQLSTAAVEVPGALLKSSSVATFAAVAAAVAPTCDKVSVYSTCNDCNEVLICLGASEDTRDCSVTSPSTPYCSNGACSAMPDSSADCLPDGIVCTGVGFFPDPKNCQLYHYCEKVSDKSSVYECPPNYVYNAETSLCKQSSQAKDCITIQCDLSKIFVSYGTSKKYYAFCQYDGTTVKSISILKCGDNSSFDGTTCVFKCPAAGNYAHADPSKYYQCYSSGGQLVYTVQSCTTGKNFDQSLKVCITAVTTTTVATNND